MLITKFQTIFLLLSLSAGILAQKPYDYNPTDPILESWRWKKFSELENGSFKCMTEDDEGNLWFLMDHHKLLRYDGYHWKEFTMPDSINPLNKNTRGSQYQIKSINNSIYVKGRSALVKFENGVFSSLLELSEITSFRLYQILELSNGSIILPTSHGLMIYGEKKIAYISSNNKTEEIKKYYPDFEWKWLFGKERGIVFKNVIETSDNELVIIVKKGYSKAIITDNVENPLIAEKLNMGVTDAGISPRTVQLNNQEIWLGSVQASFPFYRFKNNDWTTVSLADKFGGTDDMKSMMLASTGVMYIGGKGTIYSYANNVWKKYASPDIPFTSEFIEIFETKTGELWIGALGGEVYKVEHSNEHWQTYKNLSYQLTDNAGNKWFIARDNKIVYSHNGNWFYYDRSHGVIDAPVRLIQHSNGTIICSGSNKGKASVSKLENNKWLHVNLPIGWSVNKNLVFEDSNNQLWLGSELPLTSDPNAPAGIIILEHLDFNNLTYDTIFRENGWGFRFPRIGIIENDNGDLISGEENMGIVIDKNKNRKTFEMANTVSKIQMSSSGNIWGATEQKGMFLLKNEGDQYIQEFIPIAGNFLSKNILDFHIQNDSSLFVISSKDVTYFDGETWINNIFNNFFHFEDRGAQIKAEGNNVWINIVPSDWTFRALTKPEDKKDFFSIKYSLDTVAPITKIVYYNKEVDKSGNALVMWEGFDYNNQTSKAELLFSYCLDDGKWSPYKNETQHNFVGLKRGKHTIQVRAKDKNGNFDTTPETIIFKVLPPIWMRPWFIIMISIFILITSYLIRNIIVRNIKLAQNNLDLKEQKEEILTQNEEIQQQAEELEAQKDALSESHKALEGSFKRFEMLSEFGQKITATLDIDSIYNMIFSYASSVIDISAFGIGLYDETEELIYYPKFINGDKVEENLTKSLSDAKSLTSLCFNKQEVIFINDIEQEAQNFGLKISEISNAASARSRIHIPLTVESKKMGLLVINSSKANAYSKEDLTNMQTLASYISIALDNAKAYDTIHDINKNTEKSINYASTIQNAFLPQAELVNDYINAFVLFKPKDIVSGDFYWFLPIENDSSKPVDVFIAAMDCTGHGVPGALMSMIGNNLLNLIVNVKQIYKPSEILYLLNDGVKNALKQEQTGNNDGMDASLARIQQLNNDDFKIHFGGAKNPLIIIRKDGSLDSIKGSRASIGGAKLRREKVFEQHEVTLKKGDQIYLISDGYADQNGPTREKFGRDNMLKLLRENAQLSMQEQQQKLEETLLAHQQKAKQRDDITVIGIRL